MKMDFTTSMKSITLSGMPMKRYLAEIIQYIALIFFNKCIVNLHDYSLMFFMQMTVHLQGLMMQSEHKSDNLALQNMWNRWQGRRLSPDVPICSHINKI